MTVNPAHTHSFAYAASGNTINATCSADGCTLPKAEDKPTATLAIVAPGHDTFGDGKDAEATISGNIDGVANPEIVYRRGAEVLPGAPTDAGTYTASITLGDATASVEYTISKAAISPAVSIEGWTCGQEANAPSLTEGSNPGDGEVTYEYAGKGDTDWSAVAPTACGDYTVRATVVETANYLGGTATVDFSIVPAEATSKSDTVPQKNTLPSTGDPLTLAAIAAFAAVGAGAVLAGRRHCG